MKLRQFVYIALVLVFTCLGSVAIGEERDFEKIVIDLENTTFEQLCGQLDSLPEGYDCKIHTSEPMIKTVDIYKDDDDEWRCYLKFIFWKDDYYISTMLQYDGKFMADIFVVTVNGICMDDHAAFMAAFPDASVEFQDDQQRVRTQFAQNDNAFLLIFEDLLTDPYLSYANVERNGVYPTTELYLEDFEGYEILHTSLDDMDVTAVEHYTETFHYGDEYLRHIYVLRDGRCMYAEFNAEGKLVTLFWSMDDSMPVDEILELNALYPEHRLYIGKIIDPYDLYYLKLEYGMPGSLGQGPDYFGVTENGTEVTVYTVSIDGYEIIYGLQYWGDSTGRWLSGRPLTLYR